MTSITKYTRSDEEQAIIKMFQGGLTATNKNKIFRARKFPRNIMENFDLFKTYFLSGEGLSNVIRTLSEKEIALLHILHFNKWITDASVFEAAYVPLPKYEKNYYRGYQTFTQRYAPVIKTIQTNLVQKGLLVQYEAPFGGNSKAERQRFMFPSAFAAYLPAPFSNLKTLNGTGVFTDENIRKKLLNAIQRTSAKTKNTISLQQNGKLHINKESFNLKALEQIKLHSWKQSDGALIMVTQFMDEGEIFSDFILYYLKQLPKDQWITPNSLNVLLTLWDDPKRRNERSSKKSYLSRCNANQWCEAGWKSGFFQKKQEKNTAYYRLEDEQTVETDFGRYLKLDEKEMVSVDLKSIPFPVLSVLAQIACFLPDSSHLAPLEPDLINISDIPSKVWEHPLIQWLEANASKFKEAFNYFRKNYGNEIIHENLLVAKITDLSLRVLVEKGLQKKHQVVVLSDEFIAFPKSALSIVERIVQKSGNAIKRKVCS